MLKDIENKWRNAYATQENNLQNKNFLIEEVDKFDEKEYNKATQEIVSNKEYASICRALNSNTNIKPDIIELVISKNGKYLIYYKGYNEFKVLKQLEKGIDFYDIESTSNQINSGNEGSEGNQTDNQYSNEYVSERNSTKTNDGIFDFNSKQDSKQKQSDSKSIRNKQELDSSFFFDESKIKEIIAGSYSQESSLDINKHITI